MPIVEIVAQKTMEQNPNLGLSIVDLIVLLWLFSNPRSYRLTMALFKSL
ncbi:MAG: hypothetical protein ACW99V_08510 [Candidatus Thorarchaeota archaeon]